MSESPSRSKKQRTEDNPTADDLRLKYPFVNYDSWLLSQPRSDSISFGLDESLIGNGAASTGPRPSPVWFGLGAESAVSPQCRSAQYSAVAHSPFAASFGDNDNLVPSMYTAGDCLESFCELRQSIPAAISLPYSDTNLIRHAELADIISNAVKRDPALYKHVWPASVLGIAVTEGVADLAVAQTPVSATHAERMPWQWELLNRGDILKAIVEALEHCNGDLVIPFRGLMLSQWVAGLLFRLSQIFVKITVVRSQLTPRVDDVCFIFCQTKRGSSKLVDKAVKMLTRLSLDSDISEGKNWGYSAPPVCFTDPAMVTWLKSVNAQLVGFVKRSFVPPTEYPSIDRLASQFRLKKFLFPEAPVEVVGFYFGSFNPVHENHIALAQFALDHLGVNRVVFVPNFDGNDEKEDVLPIQHRAAMLKARLQGTAGMDTVTPSAPTKRWEAKASFAEETVTRIFEESRSSGQPALLLGQDSWNKAVLGSSRDKTTRHFIGISKLVKVKFIIFPRTDQAEPVLPAPKPIRENITIVDGFADPIPGLSSSKVRNAFQRGETPQGVHASVSEYIRTHRLYSSG